MNSRDVPLARFIREMVPRGLASLDRLTVGSHNLVGPTIVRNAVGLVGMFEGREQRFTNLMRFREIVPNERIVEDYRTPDPDDPDRFRMTVTFDEQADGKTVLTMRQLHPSRERRRAVIDFGAVEYGMQTLEGLKTWLEG